jgi:hypothetical protein
MEVILVSVAGRMATFLGFRVLKYMAVRGQWSWPPLAAVGLILSGGALRRG